MIAQRVTKGFVDLLDFIDLHGQQGNPSPLVNGQLGFSLQAVLQHLAVGQASHGINVCNPERLLLSLLLPGGVMSTEHDIALVFVLKISCVQLDRDHSSVGLAPIAGQCPAANLPQRVQTVVPHVGPPVRCDVEDGHPRQLFLGVSKQLPSGRVHVVKLPIFRDHQHRHG